MEATLLGLICLIGEEGVDWCGWDWGWEEWQLWFWVHKN